MKRNIIDVIAIILGCTLMALGVVLFLLPNQLSSGGFSGITTVLYYLFGFKMGTTTLIMNVPLFIIAFFKFGKRFFVKALSGTIVFSILLNVLQHLFRSIEVITEDRLLASIYGGIIIRNWYSCNFKI